MSPGGGDSVAAADTLEAAGVALEAAGVAGAAGALLELLQAAAQSPAAARTRIRRVTTAALAMSMPGRYKEAGKRHRCAR